MKYENELAVYSDGGGNIYIPYFEEFSANAALMKSKEANQWQYDVFSQTLYPRKLVADNDKESVVEKLKTIDYTPLYGDIAGIDEFVESLSGIRWFYNMPITLPERVHKYASKTNALNKMATESDRVPNGIDKYRNEAEVAIYEATVRTHKYLTVRYVFDSVAAVRPMIPCGTDASLYCAAMFVCKDLIDPKHIEHLSARWHVWRKGYGVIGDVNGRIYAYNSNSDTALGRKPILR